MKQLESLEGSGTKSTGQKTRQWIYEDGSMKNSEEGKQEMPIIHSVPHSQRNLVEVVLRLGHVWPGALPDIDNYRITTNLTFYLES